MKKIFFLSILSLFALQLCFAQQLQKQRTNEDLEQVAKSYGLESEMSRFKNTALLYYNKEQLAEYFRNESENLKFRKEMEAFRAQSHNVRSHNDFYMLISKYPTVKAKFMEAQGGEAAFVARIKESQKYKWRIYRNDAGGISFNRADQPITQAELKQGKRIDNLPRVRE